MSFKNKYIFTEKALMMELLADYYFQVIESNEKIYILIMSELNLNDNEEIEISLSKKDNEVIINNINNNINKLTEVSFEALLLDDDKVPTGNVLSYNISSNEIKELNNIIKKYKNINLIHFIVKNIEDIENLMEDISFDLGDCDDIISDIADKNKNYGISNKTSKNLSKLALDLSIDNGIVSPFGFINNTKEIQDLNIKNLLVKNSFISDIKTFNIKV